MIEYPIFKETEKIKLKLLEDKAWFRSKSCTAKQDCEEWETIAIILRTIREGRQ